MKKFLLIFFLLLMNPVYSQVSNQDILDRINEIEDTKLFNYYLNEISKSPNLVRNSNLKNDRDFYFLGGDNQSDFYIYKPSIKKDEYGILFITVVSNRVPKYFNNKTYFSSSIGMWAFCEFPRIKVLGRTYYSGENLTGSVVAENEKTMIIKEDAIKTDPIFGKMKSYICR